MSSVKLFSLLVIIVGRFLSTVATLHSLSCNFNDGNLCHYASPDLTAWKIHSGQNPEVLHGPRSSLEGSRRFLQMIGNIGMLDSPEVRLSGSYCISLDYFHVGSKQSELIIFAESTFGGQRDNFTVRMRDNRFSTTSIPLFALGEQHNYVDSWQHFEMTVSLPGDTYQVLIDGKANQDLFDVMAMDNLRFEEGPCPVQEQDAKYCDFDNVFGSIEPHNYKCDWMSVVNNASHRTEVMIGYFNGYEKDYSTKSQYGGYLEIGDDWSRAQIPFPTFTPEMGRHCLSFAAKSGSTPFVNNFVVFETAVESGHEHILLEETNTEGSVWRMHNIEIDPVVTLNVTLQLRGQRLRLDSVRLEPGKCPKPVDCKFHNNKCSWELNKLWNIGRGRLTVPSDHNDADYPYNYLYHDFTLKGQPLQRNSILSDSTRTGGNYCFKFVYKAQNSTTIHVATRFGFQDDPEFFELPEYPSERDGEWTIGYRDIKEYNHFRVRIALETRGRRGRDVQIFKLREVELLDGQCGQMIPPPLFTSVQFHCFQTGHYIPMYRSCDGVIDCPMGEDEGTQCSSGHDCSSGGIPCRRRGHKFCLKNTELLCNGVNDCDDSVDEDPRMCNREFFCDNYCLNGGVCQHDSFSCACEAGFAGKRCS